MIDPGQAFVAVRALNFALAMGLFGAAVFVNWIAPEPLADELRRRFSRAYFWAAIAACLTTAAWLPIEAATIAEAWPAAMPPDVLDLARETHLGRVWIIRLALATCLVIVTASPCTALKSPSAVVSAALLATLALIGHASMHEGAIAIAHGANEMMHVLASGFWVGSLMPLMASASLLERSETRWAAAAALHRFSLFATLAVIIVITTGIANTWLVLGSSWTDFDEPYQLRLALKLSAVAGMLALAALNRFRLAPRASEGDVRSIYLLRMSIAADLVLAACALALVAQMGTLDPH